MSLSDCLESSMARTKNNKAKTQQNSSAEVSKAASDAENNNGKTKRSTANISESASDVEKDNQELKDLIKVRFERAIHTQRLSYAQGIAARAEDGPGAVEAAARGESEAVPAEIESDSWLDTQHVEGTIQSLVAEKPKLRNTVGVFPVFTIETMEHLAQDAAEIKIIQDLGLPTRRTPAGDVALIERPLPSIVGLNKKQLAAREKELNKRNKEAQERREQASEILAENDMTTNELFQLFLEAMADSEHAFLGNPKTPNLRFDDCTQFIIPIRKNANHYTTAVVHLYEEEDTWIADIKYYDSMGGEMDDNLQAQLIAFFTSRGYEPQYKCVSESDQKEGHNCSIFASFKSIDIANENIGEEDRLLDKLTDDNYEQRMNYYRYIVTLKLKEMGQNVSASEGLTEDIVQQQKEFAKLSRHSQQVTVLNRLLTDIITQSNNVINNVQGKKGTQKAVKSSSDSKKPISDLDPKRLFAQCDEQCKRMNELLKERLQKARKSAKDKNDIKLLTGAITAFKTIREDLKRDLTKITGKKSVLNNVAPAGVNLSWFEKLSWKQTLLYGAVGSAILFVGFPYALAFMIQLSAAAPTNPFISIALGAGAFAVGLQTLSWIANFINSDKKETTAANSTVSIDSASLEEEDDEQVCEEECEEELEDDLEDNVEEGIEILNMDDTAPPLVSHFNKTRAQGKTKPHPSADKSVESSDDVVFIKETQASRAKKKLAFS